MQIPGRLLPHVFRTFLGETSREHHHPQLVQPLRQSHPKSRITSSDEHTLFGDVRDFLFARVDIVVVPEPGDEEKHKYTCPAQHCRASDLGLLIMYELWEVCYGECQFISVGV